jgi:hypothetical protein
MTESTVFWGDFEESVGYSVALGTTFQAVTAADVGTGMTNDAVSHAFRARSDLTEVFKSIKRR